MQDRIPKQYRQGDIYFQAGKPEGKLSAWNGPVIAYGETTGHAHRVATPLDQIESCVDEKGQIWLKNANGPLVIEHEEHGPISLDQGEWFNVSRQREYDPIEQMNRQVVD